MFEFTNENNLLCDYGCGRIARFENDYGKHCCEDSPNKCPAVKEKNREKAIERSKNGFYKQDHIRAKVSNGLKNSRRHKEACERRKKPKIYHPGKCEVCGNDHDGTYGSGKYCCESCARKASSLKCDRESKNRKISQTLKSKPKEEKIRTATKATQTYNKNHLHSKRIPTYNKQCKCCGSKYQYKKQCKYPEICHFILTSKPSILETYQFDFSTLGSEKVYEEYNELKNRLHKEYIINKLSISEITEKYNTDEVYLTWCLLKRLNIPLREISNSVQLSILKGRRNNQSEDFTPNQYQQSWYTTWDNNKVFLRSSYEKDFAQYLDNLKIHYEVENLRIPYYSHLKNKIVVSICDFYVPSTNTIYEIKSDFTYTKQDIIDRFTIYKSKGYTPILVLEHKEFDFDHLPDQRLSKTINSYF